MASGLAPRNQGDRSFRAAFQLLIVREVNEGPVLPLGSFLRELPFQYKPELRWGYPLNLSISVSGGRETNQDSLSKGD